MIESVGVLKDQSLCRNFWKGAGLLSRNEVEGEHSAHAPCSSKAILPNKVRSKVEVEAVSGLRMYSVFCLLNTRQCVRSHRKISDNVGLTFA